MLEHQPILRNYGPPISPPAKAGRENPSLVPPDLDGENPLAEKLKERKEPRLSDLNPLLYPPDLGNHEAMDAFSKIIQRKINEHQGQTPSAIETVIAYDEDSRSALYRLVIRFDLQNLDEDQVSQLEDIVKQTYGPQARTRKGNSGSKISPTSYPPIERTKRGGNTKKKTSRYLGWYMGLNPLELNNFHTGVLVFKDLGEAEMGEYFRRKDPKDWFYRDDLRTPLGKTLKTKYLVEIREAGLYQTDIVQLAVRVASVLNKKGDIKSQSLLYEIYNDLNRLNLKKASLDTIHGLDEQIDRVKRVLILPLANLGLSTGLELPPGSVLFIGVPGTGKTLIAEYLLQEDTGVFILPLDPIDLAKELHLPPEQRKILPRIAEVFNKTQIPVIVHMDDIENIGTDDTQINSTLLNLMAGIRENGFLAIASTNHPEKLNMQLLQPQRFAHVVYLGLHDEEARRGILDIHATRISRELNMPLFDSEEERSQIIRALAKITEGFTPRFLAEICTEAKTFYLRRIVEQKRVAKGLTEEDIRDSTFSPQDWDNAFGEVIAKYNKEATIKRDRELQKFVRQLARPLGFNPDGHHETSFLPTYEALKSQNE